MREQQQQRGTERGWHRDGKGRMFREEGGAAAYKSEDDRDAALEDVYTWRPCVAVDCCPSMLASISRHSEELVPEYMRWAQSRNVREVFDSETQRQWERERFGAPLYASAHQLLLFGVRVARFGTVKPKKAKPQTIPGMSNADGLERIRTIVEKIVKQRQPGEDI